MAIELIEGRFLASEEKGQVSSLLLKPDDAQTVIVLGHGASTHMRHPTLQSAAEAFARAGIATMRYNFPYAETRSGRNSNEVCMATVRAAVKQAQNQAGGLKVVAGGHSFSGRMTSSAVAAKSIPGIDGLVFLAFPLHPAGRPGVERAIHLKEIEIPMLFLSGTRDKLAELPLMEATCQQLGPRATLCLLETADHGFKILKRTRKSTEDIFDEMARLTQDWLARI